MAREEAVKLMKDLGIILANCYTLSAKIPNIRQSTHWKKISKILESAREFPMENVEVDREALMSKIRAKYREACQVFPELLPLTADTDSLTKKLEF